MFQKLLLLFIVIPIVEFWIFMKLSDLVTWQATILIIIITGVVGAKLVKEQGGQALKTFKNTLAEGKIPHNEAVDGILILLAGAVLITPGFLTDIVGFALLLPPVRALFKGQLGGWLKDSIKEPSVGIPRAAESNEPNTMKQAKGRVVDTE